MGSQNRKTNNCAEEQRSEDWNSSTLYRVSIKSFPDYKHLLQENYVEYKHILFYRYLS